MTRHHRWATCVGTRALTALVLFVVLCVPASLRAQGRSHGFVTVGTGATQLNVGLDVVPKRGPIGVGAEVGLGWAFLGQFTGSWHPFRHSRHDLFATVGYAVLGSGEFSSKGATVGGGAVLWPSRHGGLRFEAFKYLPMQTDYSISEDRRSPSTYWGVSAGVAFRFR